MTGRTFKQTDTVDFVVVGSGAAGGVMARELSQAGFEVLVLEQGPRFTAADFRHDELDYWFNGGISNKLDTNPQTFRKSASEVAQRVHDFPAAWYAPTVGGSSTHFTANFWRFHENDFNEKSLIGAIPGTISHALLGHIDWRIAAGLAVGVIPGAMIGARFTLGSAERTVRLGFAALLLVTGAWLAVSTVVGWAS